MTKKRKDLKVGSPEWISAWKRTLCEGFIMRCMLEPSIHYMRFWMKSFLMDDSNCIYQIRFERFLGDTIAAPRATSTKYDAPLEAFLNDLENFWVGETMHNYLTIQKLSLVVPHRGFIRPLGNSNVVLLPTNHPVLMANYGAVREWAYQAKRGLVKSDNTLAEEALDDKVITYDQHERVLWQVFERRFKTFLYQQELSVIRDTVGEVVSAEHG